MLCVIAVIDPVAREWLRRLQRVAEESYGIPPRHLHGHITMLTFMGEDEAGFIAECSRRLAGQRSFGVRYCGIDMLPPTPSIVAWPAMEGELWDVQRRMTVGWEEQLDRWTRPDAWVPHTTLVFAPEADLKPVTATMRAAFMPFTAQVCAIEFSRVLPEGGYEIADRIELE